MRENDKNHSAQSSDEKLLRALDERIGQSSPRIEQPPSRSKNNFTLLRRTPIEPDSSATFTVSPFSSTGEFGVKITNLPKGGRYRLQMELYR